jgi:hypothetical protein
MEVCRAWSRGSQNIYHDNAWQNPRKRKQAGAEDHRNWKAGRFFLKTAQSVINFQGAANPRSEKIGWSAMATIHCLEAAFQCYQIRNQPGQGHCLPGTA